MPKNLSDVRLAANYGTVKPYTVHEESCPLFNKRDDQGKPVEDNSCVNTCIRYLYVYRKPIPEIPDEPLFTGRRSLFTKSWTEALQRAGEEFETMHPSARLLNRQRRIEDAKLIKVADAFQMWIDRTPTNDEGEPTTTVAQYKTIQNKAVRFAKLHGIRFIQGFTPTVCDTWYKSKDFQTLKANTTRPQRWSCVNSIFNWLVAQKYLTHNPIPGVTVPVVKQGKVRAQVQGAYTKKQTDAVYAWATAHPYEYNELLGPEDDQSSETARARMLAFLIGLLHLGCDVIDMAYFDKKKLTREHHDGKGMVWVYRYERTKTGVKGFIMLQPEIARQLRDIPEVDGRVPGQPYRPIFTREKSFEEQQTALSKKWSNRVAICLAEAKVLWADTGEVDKYGAPILHKANPKQYRHTCAVNALVSGMRTEEVRLLLAHAKIETLLLHYKPHIKDIDSATIAAILKDHRHAHALIDHEALDDQELIAPAFSA